MGISVGRAMAVKMWRKIIKRQEIKDPEGWVR